MSTGRAIATETELEYLAGEHGKQRQYEAKSRIKKRIRDQLTRDIEEFDTHEPELNEVLRDVVCEGRDDG